MNCETVARQLPLMLYGELTFDEEEDLQAHLDNCAQCRSGIAQTRQLHRSLDACEFEVPPELLTTARRNLRLSVAASQPDRRPSWFGFLWPGFGERSWQSIVRPALALSVVAAAFVAGRYTQLPFAPGPSLPAGASGAAAWRVRYVQPEESGRVQIVVEEVRQKILKGGLNDDAIRPLLVAATREAHDPGVRVETMDLLKGQSDTSEVRRALLSALQHDPNPGVRLKALEALRTTPADSDTRRVLTQVLLTDVNPGVRTQAVDLLTRQRGPEMVGVLQELVSKEDNTYIRLKCQKALREMNASVETF